MIKLSLATVAQTIPYSILNQNAEFQGISIDTRTLLPGNLYIAIMGEQFDGHQFITQAEEKGASALLVSTPVDSTLPQLIVNDTVSALGQLSKLWRNYFSLPLIGVTGSNGKTTLKNMIASILTAACEGDSKQVLATQGNLNNHIGVPLTLAKLNTHHRYGVIEMGMNHFGEIAYLTELTRPQIAVINNAAASHLEGLQDIAGVARAKGEIFLGLPANGIAILNQDDTHFSYWHRLIGKRAYLSFGLHSTADVTATLSANPYINLFTPQGQIEINLPLLGEHNILNALAASATALALKIDLPIIKKGLETVQAAPGRMHKYQLPNQICVIDDSYNANPFSLNAAIQTLAQFRGPKIIVLGDMKELGDEAKQLHIDAGKAIASAGIDYLFTLGDLSQATTEAFGKNGHHFKDYPTLLTTLKSHLTTGTTLLVKGSRSMHMEKVVAELVPQEQWVPIYS